MESLEELINQLDVLKLQQQLGLTELDLLLCMLILGAIILWLLAVLKTRQYQRMCNTLEQELEERQQAADRRAHTDQEQIEELGRSVEALERRTYLTSFPDGSICRLLGKWKIKSEGEMHWYGLVQDEKGKARLFFTTQPMAHLQPKDRFSVLHGQLVVLSTAGGHGSIRQFPGGVRSGPTGNVSGPNRPATASGDQSPSSASSLDLFKSDAQDIGPGARERASLPYMRVISGPDAGARFPLRFSRTTIGQGKTNLIALNDPNLGRLHCQVVYQDNNFILEEEQGAGGVYCNDKGVVGSQELGFGDLIRIGQTELVFSCPGYDLKETNPDAAINAFESVLTREPDYLAALNHLAFLLERNVGRKREAKPMWERIAILEARRRARDQRNG